MGNLSGNEFNCNSSGNTQPQSSQFAEPLWTDPGIHDKECKELVCVCEPPLKKIEEVQAGNE